MAAVAGKRRVGEKVYCNVYDLSPANDYGWGVGLGAFHSGIEVYGVEYSFGSGGGVFAATPRDAGGAKFREAVLLGEVFISEREVRAVVDSLREEFPGSSYNIITRNCNTFSNELARLLLDKPVPGYINRLANMGSFMSCLLPRSLTGAAPVEGEGAAAGGRAGAGGGGAYARGSSAPAPRHAPAFAGSGMTLGGAGGATASASAAPAVPDGDRRAAMARAAEARARAAAGSSSAGSSTTAGPGTAGLKAS